MASSFSLADFKHRLRERVKRFFRSVGFEVRAFNPQNAALARRRRLLDHYGIDFIFDVGANTGGYAIEMRENGYLGRIVSFEPLAVAFEELSRRAAQDPRWDAVHTALGRDSGTATINVGESHACSSLLEVLPTTVEVVPHTAHVRTEEIRLQTLDALFDQYYTGQERAFLKIDAQGYEHTILEGATRSLEHLVGVQMEMALVPQYAGETLFQDMVAYMAARGFTLMSIETVLTHPITGQILQVDGLFFRSAA